MKEYGLVLTGGGTRGAYQLGVWKALDEQKVPIRAVAGVSIGAINGALFCQGDYQLAWRAWHEIRIDDLIELPEELPVPDNVFDPRNLPVLVRLVISEKGLDTTPLRRRMEQYLSEEKVRQSNIDLGILTFSLTDLKPVGLFLDEIMPGQLFDYLLASASLPLFRTVCIDGKRLIDGGVYNNKPTEMLLNRGFSNIIEVDVGKIGIVRPYNAEGARIISIKPEKPVGGILDVRQEIIDANIRQGYLDAMRMITKERLLLFDA